jgi:hypothetical protein
MKSDPVEKIMCSRQLLPWRSYCVVFQIKIPNFVPALRNRWREKEWPTNVASGKNLYKAENYGFN